MDENFCIEEENADKQFIELLIGLTAWVGLVVLAIISLV